MPCPICKKGRYSRPHGACKRQRTARLQRATERLYTNYTYRLFEAAFRDLSEFVRDRNKGWRPADEAQFKEWMEE